MRVMFFYAFFCNIIKIKYFCTISLYYYKFLLSYIIDLSSFYRHMFLSNQLIAFSYHHLHLKQFFNFFSKILCFSLLNLCCIFNISLLFFMSSFWSSLRLSTSVLFFLNTLIDFQLELLLKKFYNLEI